MLTLFKSLIKRTPLYRPIVKWLEKKVRYKEASLWKRAGKPVPPPPIIKQLKLRSLAKSFKLRVLVETGTFQGDMVEAMRPYFSKIYSIELSTDLYNLAQHRFKDANGIVLINADSGEGLKSIIDQLKSPALFWLDAHYSGGVTAIGTKYTPILEELNCIFNSPISGHVIAIDDARLFGANPAYPNVEELFAFVRSNRPHARISIEDDVINIVT